ncbi:MAG TPA: DUF885 domain-containing protein, partial [Candidatus Limnocylindrales bacterium]
MAEATNPAATGATADQRFEALVEARFRWSVEHSPVFGSFLGLHEFDDRLSDGTRESVLEDLAVARDFLGQLEELEPASLSAANRIERELALLTTRRRIFDLDVARQWERRGSVTDEVGEAVFVLFARGSRPLADRLMSVAARLEQVPRLARERRSHLGEHPQRLWNELEIDAAGSLPALFGEVITAAEAEFGDGAAETGRLRAASAAAAAALDDYTSWLREQIGRADDDFALGGDAYDELIELRAFDGLDADQILEIGQQQLAEQKAARVAVAREIDATASEAEVLDRVKSNQPRDFEAALAGYRRAMDEAKAFIAEQGICSIPAAEKLSVVPTPEFLRKVIPFAAYFPPAKFEPVREGVYIVTPSVDGDARAMREHNWASIYNTSIHEAFPGHHLQLSAALDHPSLVRLLVDAPEFVEGWAMYCEQMMREEGFDTTAEHRLMMHTDAIWRACRIILDVRLQRREMGIDQAVDFLVEHTGFERPNATAEVHRYTLTPSYPLSYLLGRVLLLRLRADEQRRLGADFSLRGFHDALLREGSIP